MAFDFGMLSGMLPGGQTQIPPTWGFDGPPPAIDPMTGMPMPAPKTELPKPAPFGPFPGVQLPGLQNDIAPTAAPAGPPTATASGMPGWLNDQTSAPVGIGGPSASPAPVPQPRPAMAPSGDINLPPNASLASGPGAPMGLTPTPPPSAPPEPGFMDRLSAASHNLSAKPGLPGIFDAISGLQSGARTDPQGRQQQVQNQTFAALVKRGLDPDTAAAVIGNPEMLKQILPSLFGGKKLINVNGVMVDEATGQKVADYSEATKWQIAKVTDPNTGIESSVLVQPATQRIKQITPGNLEQATGQGGPASGNMTLPPEVKNMPPSLQFRNAPDGSTATLGGRPVIKRGGRWEYVQ